MDLPLVSICIPTYNRSSFLREAIASALATDYPNIEVVVSDNASTDDTCNVVEEFNDDRIKYFINKKNIGVFLNIRKVLYEHAKGEYAIYLADDDYYIDETYISKAVELFTKYPDIVMIFSNWRYVKEDRHKDILLPLESVCSGIELVKSFFPTRKKESRLLLMFYTCLFKREMAVNIDAWSLDTKKCFECEILFMLKIMIHGSVGYLNNISFVQRLHDKNYSAIVPYNILFENMFVMSNELERYFQPYNISDFFVKKVKIYHQERDIVFGRMMLEERKSRSQLFPLLLSFLAKVYRQNPLLLSFLVKPQIILQVLIRFFSPSMYFFLKDKVRAKKIHLDWE